MSVLTEWANSDASFAIFSLPRLEEYTFYVSNLCEENLKSFSIKVGILLGGGEGVGRGGDGVGRGRGLPKQLSNPLRKSK